MSTNSLWGRVLTWSLSDTRRRRGGTLYQASEERARTSEWRTPGPKLTRAERVPHSMTSCAEGAGTPGDRDGSQGAHQGWEAPFQLPAQSTAAPQAPKSQHLVHSGLETGPRGWPSSPSSACSACSSLRRLLLVEKTCPWP